MSRWKAIRALFQSTFVRRVAQVSTGHLIAQIAAFAAAPLLSFVYEPQVYASVGVFSAAVSTGLAVATGRYEFGIPLPAGDRRGIEAAAGLFRLALCCLGVFSVLLSLSLLAAKGFGLSPFEDALGSLIFMVPLGILVSGLFSALNMWHIRAGAFGTVGSAAATRPVASYSLQLALGALSASRASLLLGAVGGVVIGVMQLLRGLGAKGLRGLFRGRSVSWKRLALRYRKFPIFDSAYTVVNTLSLSLPVLAFPVLYGLEEVGLVVMATRILALPAAVLGTGIAQVYLREAAASRGSRQTATILFAKTVRTLAVLSLVPFAAFGLLADYISTLVFGSAWADLGTYFVLLLPMVWIRFVASPVSSTFIVYERQGLALGWQCAMFIGCFGAIIAASTSGRDAEFAVLAYSIMAGAFYLVQIILGRLVVRFSNI